MRVPSFSSSVLSLLVLTCGPCAFASETAREPRAFDIVGSPVDVALRQFAAQSGLEVLFATDAAQGVTTNALKGRMPAAQAIAQLLAGTPLSVVKTTRSGVLRIARTPAPKGSLAAPPPKTTFRTKPFPSHTFTPFT